MIVYGQGATMFSDEELRGITNIEKGPNYIAAKCVLKSQDHGELPGRLMVFPEGKLEISCECYPGCPKGNSLSLSLSHTHTQVSNR